MVRLSYSFRLCRWAVKSRIYDKSKVSLSRVIEDGFTVLINEEDKHVKVMVDLSAS